MASSLNLNLNPVMELYARCYEPVSINIHGLSIQKNEENNARIQELEDIKNFLVQLNADHKEGIDQIDFTAYPEKRALVDKLREKYQLPIQGYRWKGKEIENLKTICNEEIRTVTAWINPTLSEMTQLLQQEHKITEILSEIITLYRQGNNTTIQNQKSH